MDSPNWKRDPQQLPFYLLGPSGNQNHPTVQPPTLTDRLNQLRDDLIEELVDESLPQKKKHETLAHFLGRKYDIGEMERDLELAQRTLGRSDSDCSLTKTVKKMQTCYMNKQLEPLTNAQLRAFNLLPQTEGVSIFDQNIEAQLNSEYKEKETFEIREKEESEKLRKKKKQMKNPSAAQQNSQELSLPAECYTPAVAVLKVERPTELASRMHYQNNPSPATAPGSIVFTSAIKEAQGLDSGGWTCRSVSSASNDHGKAGLLGKVKSNVSVQCERGEPKNAYTTQTTVVVFRDRSPETPPQTKMNSKYAVSKFNGLKMTIRNQSDSSPLSSSSKTSSSASKTSPFASEGQNFCSEEEELKIKKPIPKLKLIMKFEGPPPNSIKMEECQSNDENQLSCQNDDDGSSLDVY